MVKIPKPLGAGDSISATLGINMPLDDSGRGSPWIKAEVSATTRIREGETYKSATVRLNKDVKQRLDKNVNYLMMELSQTKKAP
jgi:hypothetical protein